MKKLISNPIKAPIEYQIKQNVIRLQHPTFTDMNKIVKLLTNEGLDIRKLAPVSHKKYLSIGEINVRKGWKVTHFPPELLIQADGIIRYKPIPPINTEIADPFNMNVIEKKDSSLDLAKKQISNTILAKVNGNIVGVGRLLDIAGTVEIASLFTKTEWRNMGIATTIIDELLGQSSIRPIYSFQVPELIPFYLQRYQKHGTAEIESFTKLPEPLKRDLFYMNIFWGPYSIITIK